MIARAKDTLSSVSNGLAIREEDRNALLAAFPRRRWFGEDAFSGGEIITVIAEDASPGGSSPPVLELEVERSDSGVVAVARTDAGRYVPVVAMQSEADATTAGLASVGFGSRSASGTTLRNSLYALVESNHVDEGIVAELMRLCGRDFDLDQALGEMDGADVLYAPSELGLPELVFVSLTAQGKTRRYYQFKARDDGSTDFYDEEGHSITKFLLRRPGGRAIGRLSGLLSSQTWISGQIGRARPLDRGNML